MVGCEQTYSLAIGYYILYFIEGNNPRFITSPPNFSKVCVETDKTIHRKSMYLSIYLYTNISNSNPDLLPWLYHFYIQRRKFFFD
jgi:hypothetical protein